MSFIEAPRQFEEYHCCPIMCIPSQQRPKDIVRNLHLLDLFVSGLTMIKTAVELKTKRQFVNKIVILSSSFVMFCHSLWLIMYYNWLISRGKLIERCNVYSFFRL